jgi:hypothetical protein
MNNIEIIIIGVIILLQLSSFFSTRSKIKKFGKIFKNISLEVIKVVIPDSVLKELKPVDILQNLPDVGESHTPENANSAITLAQITSSNETIQKIAFSVNTYLLQNRNTATEFNVFKDIVSRNCSNEDDEISLMLPIPLYLGLLGTIIGIIFGLSAMSFIDTDDFLKGDTIPHFLQGVMMAMIASGTGLFLTILNTAISYKKAKVTLEKGENEFYDFIQTSLLPVSTQNIAVSINSLQKNLSSFTDKFIGNIHSFNSSFESNMEILSSTIDKNFEAIKSEQAILEHLEKIDITELAKVNITTFKELQKGANQFKQFGAYMKDLNLFIDKTEKQITHVDNLFGRFKGIEDNSERIANHIIEQIDDNKSLMKFIQSHFGELEQNRTLINNVVAENNENVKKIVTINNEFWEKSLDNNKKNMADATADLSIALDKTLTQLKEITEQKIKEIHDSAVDEKMKLEGMLNINNTNLSNLNKLSFLEKMHKNSVENQNQQAQIIAALKQLNRNVAVQRRKEDEKKSLLQTIRGFFVKK